MFFEVFLDLTEFPIDFTGVPPGRSLSGIGSADRRDFRRDWFSFFFCFLLFRSNAVFFLLMLFRYSGMSTWANRAADAIAVARGGRPPGFYRVVLLFLFFFSLGVLFFSFFFLCRTCCSGGARCCDRPRPVLSPWRLWHWGRERERIVPGCFTEFFFFFDCVCLVSLYLAGTVKQTGRRWRRWAGRRGPPARRISFIFCVVFSFGFLFIFFVYRNVPPPPPPPPYFFSLFALFFSRRFCFG